MSLVRSVLDGQRPSGAFASTMRDEGADAPDDNGFVTARVLGGLEASSLPPPLAPAVERALDFLEGCAAPELPGAFRFWPDEQRPAHVPRYPPDADDTALISLQLARFGRRSRDDLRRIVAYVLLRHRVSAGARPAPWVRPGAFWTWLDDGFGYNLVDCVVNANVVALICAAGLRGITGYGDACAMVDLAVRLAIDDPFSLRMISPYYPQPRDLRDAVGRAVDAGAGELAPCLERLRERFGDGAEPDHSPVCTSAYGKVRWTAPLVRRLDRLRLGHTEDGA